MWMVSRRTLCIQRLAAGTQHITNDRAPKLQAQSPHSVSSQGPLEPMPTAAEFLVGDDHRAGPEHGSTPRAGRPNPRAQTLGHVLL